MKVSLDTQRERRDLFLAEVVDSLSKDERFVAAWLRGSISRGEADALSDIDISIVVSEEHSAGLCRRLEQVSATTSPERLSFFSQFGTAALIHENNNNAPEEATFTFVMYSEIAVMVDWILIPQSKAKRPYQSQLLFEHVEIPVLPSAVPGSLEQRRKSVSEQWGFFWMMTAITVKYIIRNDGVFATHWIENLHSIYREMERKINGEPWSYVRGSLSQLQTTPESQLQSLKDLCSRMQELKPQVAKFTGTEPLTPITEIEMLSSLVTDA